MITRAKIINLLDDERHKLNLSQTDYSEYLGMTKTWFTHLYTGYTQNPNFDKLQQALDVLGYELLIARKGWQSRKKKQQVQAKEQKTISIEGSIADLIKKMRHEQNLSMRSLSEIGGLSPKTLASIENGDTLNPGILTLIDVFGALGYEIALKEV